MELQAYKAALEWYLDNGVDEALGDTVVDRYAASAALFAAPLTSAPAGETVSERNQNSKKTQVSAPALAPSHAPLGAADARAQAIKLANAAKNVEELRAAIQEFDGLGLKRTATNLVFASGELGSKVMYIGEAPSAEDDRSGQVLSAREGALLDAMFKAIKVSRNSAEGVTGIYISNILNWRPPGGRSPAPGEIETSLPFIERHIQLAAPEILVFGGGTVAKALLGRSEGLSKLRKKWHDYTPQTKGLMEEAKVIPAIVTLPPAYLLNAPLQKRDAWADLLEIQKKLF